MGLQNPEFEREAYSYSFEQMLREAEERMEFEQEYSEYVDEVDREEEY